MSRRRARSQRAFDLAVAVSGLLLSGALWPAIALAIRLTSPGPIFFRAPRLGLGGLEFTIVKFRTMTTGVAGPSVTVSGDRRVTAIGRVLRKLKLDELPQLLNVLRGEMSIVGWRPEHPEFVADYPEELRAIFDHRPGITSPASLRFRHEESILAERGGDLRQVYVQEILPAKVTLDLEYLRAATVRSDLGIVVATAAAVLKVRH